MNHIQNVDTLFSAYLRSIGALEDITSEAVEEDASNAAGDEAKTGDAREVEVIRK